MKSRVIGESSRAFLLVFDRGDEVAATLTAFAASHDIGGARFTAIGACERATIAYWNASTKQYEHIEIEEQVEIVSLIGNIARDEDGKPRLHGHVAIGRRDGTLVGGHFIEGRVHPTLELFLDVLAAPIDRRKDEGTGLQLIVPE
jgi:predicted DNA-binding protein with PD1-like motif